MNIFILDECPYKAAQQQCDKHIVKMPTESAQMLSTAHRVLDGKLVMRPSNSGKRMVKYWDLFEGADDLEAETLYYKAVHVNHPCTVWTMESDSNYRWHWEHYYALCKEYTHRYGKTHGAEKLLFPLRSAPRSIPIGPLTPFRLAMGANPECVIPGDPVQSYRLFYQTKQERFKMTWRDRMPPEWFKQVA